MRIALDLDGVVYDWDQRAQTLLARWYRAQRRRGGTRSLPDLLATVPTPRATLREVVYPEAWEWLWRDGVLRYGLFRAGHPIPGALRGVRALVDQGHTVTVVTARPGSPSPRTRLAPGVADTVRRDTETWVARHLPGANGIVFTARKHEFPADLYVDDDPHILRDLVTHGRRALRFARPQNAHLDGAHQYLHARTWPEVVRIVIRLALAEMLR